MMSYISSRASCRFVALLLPVCLAACGGSSDRLPMHELIGSTMGTSFSVKVVAPPADADMNAMRETIGATLADIEQSMSTYIDDSELSRFNAEQVTDWYSVSAELCAVIEAAQAMAMLTDGAFDITVGPLVDLWGFGPEGPSAGPPADAAIDALRAASGYELLHADCNRPAVRKERPDVRLDLSAIAKGYAVDRIAELLSNAGMVNYLVEIGGELRARGRNAEGRLWAIAIESPSSGGRSVHTIVRLADAGMATSGDYRNFFEHGGVRYSHTLDPASGRPVTHAAASVTVVAPTTMRADALATALLVLGPRAGLELAERESIAAYFLVRSDDGFEPRMSRHFSLDVEAG